MGRIRYVEGDENDDDERKSDENAPQRRLTATQKGEGGVRANQSTAQGGDAVAGGEVLREKS